MAMGPPAVEDPAPGLRGNLSRTRAAATGRVWTSGIEPCKNWLSFSVLRVYKSDEPGRRFGRILVRVPNWLGDAVLALPVLEALRQALPDSEVTVLARPWVSALFTDSPAYRVMVEEAAGRHGGFGGRLRLARDLSRQGFDLALLLTNSFDTALVASLARIPERVGYAADGRRWLLTRPVSPDGRVHQRDRYLELLAAIGVEGSQKEPRLAVRPGDAQGANRLLQEAGLDDAPLPVGLVPGSVYGSAKRWPADRFAALADLLADRLGGRSLLLGSASEGSVAAAVSQASRSCPVDLTGRTSLGVLGGILARCGAAVTNDTGAMHLAAAVGTPVVALFGPTDPQATGPLGPAHRIVRRDVPCSPCLLRECPIDHRCMEGITEETVWRALVSALAGGGTAPAVFLDRDGTLNTELGFLSDPEGLELLPGTAGALRLLCTRGFKQIVVSNQSGVARGLISGEALSAVNARLLEILAAQGATVDGIYVCPHHPTTGQGSYRTDCGCRKPRGLLGIQAAREHGIALDRSFMVGDHLSDVAFGRYLGMRSILVLTGHGREEAERQGEGHSRPDYVARDLAEAAAWIAEAAR